MAPCYDRDCPETIQLAMPMGWLVASTEPTALPAAASKSEPAFAVRSLSHAANSPRS